VYPIDTCKMAAGVAFYADLLRKAVSLDSLTNRGKFGLAEGIVRVVMMLVLEY
jgi:hypothetical protein